MQALVDRHRQFVDNTLTNGKPVKFTQYGRDVIKHPGLRRHASCKYHAVKSNQIESKAKRSPA